MRIYQDRLGTGATKAHRTSTVMPLCLLPQRHAVLCGTARAVLGAALCTTSEECNAVWNRIAVSCHSDRAGTRNGAR